MGSMSERRNDEGRNIFKEPDRVEWGHKFLNFYLFY